MTSFQRAVLIGTATFFLDIEEELLYNKRMKKKKLTKILKTPLTRVNFKHPQVSDGDRKILKEELGIDVDIEYCEYIRSKRGKKEIRKNWKHDLDYFE